MALSNNMSQKRKTLLDLSKKSGYQRSTISSLICFLCIVLVILAFFNTYMDYSMLLSSKAAASPHGEDFEFTECLHQVLNELPLGNGRQKRFQKFSKKIEFEHHYTANTGLWNMDERFNAIPGITAQSTSCSIWEVGAHTRAEDTATFLKMYPRCEYHAYEPVPDFYRELDAHWIEKKKSEVEENKEIRFTAHNYGIDSSDLSVKTSRSSLKGQGSYLGNTISEEGSDSEVINLQIRSFDYAIQDASGKIPILFNVNCEGCEWEMLPNLLSSSSMEQRKMFRKIPIIQFGTHNYGKNLGQRAWELCKIREQLSESHKMIFGVAFGWERWVKK